MLNLYKNILSLKGKKANFQNRQYLEPRAQWPVLNYGISCFMPDFIEFFMSLKTPENAPPE